MDSLFAVNPSRDYGSRAPWPNTAIISRGAEKPVAPVVGVGRAEKLPDRFHQLLRGDNPIAIVIHAFERLGGALSIDSIDAEKHRIVGKGELAVAVVVGSPRSIWDMAATAIWYPSFVLSILS